MADLLMLVQHRDGGSGYHFRNELRLDPLLPCFAGFDSVCVGWCSVRGRCVLTTRPVIRGELLMKVPALGHVKFDSMQQSSISSSYELDELGLDHATMALSRCCLTNKAHHRLVAALNAPRLDETALRRISDQLRSCSPLPSAMAGLDDRELTSLCLRIKCNLHLSLDDETATRATGMGLYPAAALLNHSCCPSACFAWSDDGQSMEVRAMIDVGAGEEITCSYLAEEHLYAPWQERAALLRNAFRFDPEEPPQRRAAEQATVAAATPPTPALERRLHSAIAAVRRGLELCEGDREGLLTAAEQLLCLVDGQLKGTVHPFHWLVQEANAALLAVARSDDGLDEPHLVAKSALHLIAAREFHLPTGTPHLAALYAAHGGALCRMMLAGAGLSAEERQEVAKSSARSFTAAHRIRCCCLGEQHPLTLATAAAEDAARQRCTLYT